MKRNLKTVLYGFVLLAMASCHGGNNTSSGNGGRRAVSVSEDSVKVKPVYAKGFEVTYRDGYKLVDVHDPLNEEVAAAHFALVPRGGRVEDLPDGYRVVEVPVENVICMTTLQLSGFIKLDELDRVVGITSTRHLHNEAMNRRIEEGRTRKIGIEGNFDNEVIMSMDPDVIFISPFKRGGYDAIREVDIPLVPHFGYKELTPLGQAEWIKFIALFIGEEEKADRIFASIEEKYIALKNLAAEAKKRPVVFSGEIRGGVWYAVGGESFLAQLFRDAGADYFLKDDKRSGGVNLDFETVYARAHEAEYWRILNSFDGTYGYDVLRDSDPRYADFKAFKDKGVIYCNLREKPFYEDSPMAPELVLADFIKVFHPELLPDYTPVFYELLK